MTMCTVDGFADALTEMVHIHITELNEGTKDAVEAAGKAAIEALKSASPYKTGKYSSSWRQKMHGSVLSGFYITEVYNTQEEKTRWLEYGHHLVYFGRKTGVFVGPRPHLDAGYQAGAAELHKRLGR